MSLTTDPTHVTEDDARYRLAPFGAAGRLEESLVLLSGRSAKLVSGDGVADFALRLREGMRSGQVFRLSELAAELGVVGAELRPVLDRLVGAGILREGHDGVSAPAIIAATRAGDQIPERTISRRLATTTVDVVARSGSILASAIGEALAELGISVERETAPPAESGHLRIVIGRSHLDSFLWEANDRSLEDGTPWLPVVPFDGAVASVGPFCIPHQSACLRCLLLRRSANFADDVFRPELLRVEAVDEPTPEFGPDPLHRVQAGIVANLVLERVALRDHAPSAAPGGLTTVGVDDSGLSVQTRRVLRVPRCPSCSPTAGTGFPQVWFHGDPVGVGQGG